MGFELLSPGWMLAAPGVLGALFILYFLKLKRREVTVASTYLWRQALQDLRVNSPFQRLRMNLLLLLQALALLAALLALARPVSNVGGLTGSDTIVLLDISASMQATDGDTGGATRFERARDEARRIVDDLSYRDRAIVLAFDDEPRVLTPLTESKATLRAALDELQPTDRPTRLDRALARARMLLAESLRDPEVFVLSDGRVGPLEGVTLEESVPLRYVRTGQATENVGVIGVDVSLPTGLGEETRVFAALQRSGGKAPLKLGVDLFLAEDDRPGDWRVIDSQEVELEPDGTASVAFDVAAQGGRLKLHLDHEDALPLDDTAFALLRPREPIRVLLVSEGNLFLDRALRSDPLVWKDPQGAIPVLAPGSFAAEDPQVRAADLIVLDRCAPDPLPAGNYLCFARAPKFPGLTDKGFGREARILDWDEAHPVARFVNFATLNLPSARRFELREGDTVVVRSNLGPLVSVARDGDRQAVLCAFDLLSLPVEGAWTFDPSYPIFLANCVRWLGGRGRDRKSLLVNCGGTAELRFPLETARALVTGPGGGEPKALDVRTGDDLLRVSGLDRVGFWEVAFQDAQGKELGRSVFAANLCDGAESVIAPAPTLELEGRRVQGQPKAEESNRDVWKIAAGVALAAVMLEWWIYNRRVYL